MAGYQYEALTRAGEKVKGTLDASSKEQAVTLLRAENYVVLRVTKENLLTAEVDLSIGGKIKARDYSIFCRQIVSILNAGVNIMEALSMMAEQTENKKLRKGILRVCDDIAEGEALGASMKKQPKVFPLMLCNLVEAGEASGSLETAFSRMAVQFEKDNKLRQSVKKAMIYPIVLIFVMIGVIMAMLLFVIPTFMGMFAELDTALPPVTQAVVDMSEFMKAKWWLVLLIFFTAVMIYKSYQASDNGKYVIGSIKLHIPIFGKLTKKTACARLGRTLSTLLGAGMPMIEALDITAKSMDNVHYRQALSEAAEQVARGVPLSKPLKACGLFPAMVIHMVAIGEETGNIESMLTNIAEYYEEDVQTTTEQVMALLEPLIIVVMAVVVGFLVIAILQPMLELYNTLGN